MMPWRSGLKPVVTSLSHVTHKSRTGGSSEGIQAGGVTTGEVWSEAFPQSRDRGWLFGGEAWLRDESLFLCMPPMNPDTRLVLGLGRLAGWPASLPPHTASAWTPGRSLAAMPAGGLPSGLPFIPSPCRLTSTRVCPTCRPRQAGASRLQGWSNRAESCGRASRFDHSAKCAPRRFDDSTIR